MMADDFDDVEAMLEAPYRDDHKRVDSASAGSSRKSEDSDHHDAHDGEDDQKPHSLNEVDEYLAQKKRQSHRTRSRSRSTSRESRRHRPTNGSVAAAGDHDVDDCDLDEAEAASSHNYNKRHKSSRKEKRRDRDRSKSRERRDDGDTKRHDRSPSRDRHPPASKRHRDKDRDVVERSSRHDRDRDRDRDRPDRTGGRHQGKSSSRRRSRSKDRSVRRRSRSTSRDRRSRRGPHHRGRSRSRSPFSGRDGRGGHPGRRGRSRSGSRGSRDGLSVEERDQRTVFCMQLAARITSRDLDKFFSSVGKVREVRLIIDNKTRRHKGIAYVEFVELESVPLALALSGEKVLGVPINIMPTQAEKNRLAAAAAAAQAAYKNASKAAARDSPGPTRLYVGSLHFNITEEMLRGIFEPFGKIERIEIMRDSETGRSRGYGFVTFTEAEDAKKALDQLNGFELAGRPMKVNTMNSGESKGGGDLSPFASSFSILDSVDMDRGGVDLGSHGRLQLMYKLAEGTGIKLPTAATAALKMPTGTGHSGFTSNGIQPPLTAPMSSSLIIAGTSSSTSPSIGPVMPSSMAGIPTTAAASAHAVATQCFMLTNMFDPATETEPDWAEEIRSDVLDQCSEHGGALHISVDQNSLGNVYVKCPAIPVAESCVKALHGRWFSGRQITAAYVPVVTYHQLFPDSLNALALLQLS